MMFPEVEPQMQMDCCFLVSVPRAVMEKHVAASELYRFPEFQIYFGPGRDIVAWTMTRREVYHLQFSDHQHGLQDRSLGSWTEPFRDMEAFRNRWADFEPAIAHILAEVDELWKWKIARVPDLPRWSNPKGSVVLLGDAAHAIPPFAGQVGLDNPPPYLLPWLNT